MVKVDRNKAIVRIVMGSKSDLDCMEESYKLLQKFKVSVDIQVVSAHRTPTKLQDFCKESEERGVQFIIAGAGGAAHLPGMLAAHTCIPVIGVPIRSKALDGLDSLLSISQMPYGVPVATMAIGEAGAKNAALLVVAVLALQDQTLKERYKKFRVQQTLKVLKTKVPKTVLKKKI